MNRKQALEIWTPEGSPWSPWAKAVLFSFLPDEISDIPSSVNSSWKVPSIKEAALVVDVAGAVGVELGISLAQSGYRPIPLYNACPYAAYGFEPDGIASQVRVHSAALTNAPSVIDVVPIIRAIERETSTLKNISLLLSAPPAFLLDVNRHHPPFPPSVGWFDNRSVVRESDVPTAAFLTEQRIQQVIIIQTKPHLLSDLRTVLLSWQEGGLRLSRQAPGEPWSPRSLTIPKPSRLKAWWDKLTLLFGYRLNSSGSFGHFVHGSGG